MPRVHMPEYSEKSDLRQFLRQFETYLNVSNVAADAHQLRLQHLLCSLPTSLYALLESEMQNAPADTFQQVTERFLAAAGCPPPDSDAKRTEFENAVIGNTEQFAAFGARLNTLAMQAYAAYTPVVRADLVLRRFINGLLPKYPAVYQALCIHHPVTLAAATQQAESVRRAEAAVAKATTKSLHVPLARPVSAQPPVIAPIAEPSALEKRVADLAECISELKNDVRSQRQFSQRRGMQPSFGRRNTRWQPDHQSNRSRGYSVGPPRNQRGACYTCGSFSHYAAQCPNVFRPNRR